MKRIFVFLAICLLLTSTHQLFAQADLSVGVKAGLNFANVNLDEAPRL
jgi:hypothetical protein